MLHQNPAEEVRKELKARGISSRRVSVRNDGSSLEIRIKDLSVCADMVKEIAEKFERIRYCEVTQEILSGGNFFVSVSYSYDAERAAKQTPEFVALLDHVTTKLAQIDGNRGIAVVPGFVVFLSQNRHSYQATIEWEPDKVWHHFSGADDLVLKIYRDRLQGKTDTPFFFSEV